MSTSSNVPSNDGHSAAAKYAAPGSATVRYPDRERTWASVSRVAPSTAAWLRGGSNPGTASAGSPVKSAGSALHVAEEVE